MQGRAGFSSRTDGCLLSAGERQVGRIFVHDTRDLKDGLEARTNNCLSGNACRKRKRVAPTEEGATRTVELSDRLRAARAVGADAGTRVIDRCSDLSTQEDGCERNRGTDNREDQRVLGGRCTGLVFEQFNEGHCAPQGHLPVSPRLRKLRLMFPC